MTVLGMESSKAVVKDGRRVEVPYFPLGFQAPISSGGVIPTNSTAVVHFPNIDRRKIQREEIPTHCGRGHPLTPGNLRIDRSQQRWRCLQCGRDRAPAFRRRRDRTA